MTRRETPLIASLLLLTFVACMSRISAQHGQTTPSPSVSKSAARPTRNTPLPSQPATAWHHYSSPQLGIRFSFPPLPGEVTYDPRSNSGGTTGTIITWQVTRRDLPQLANPWTYDFAGGASFDAGEPRETWYTDVYRWFAQGGKTLVEQPGGYKYAVSPLRIVRRSDGLLGVIFDPTKTEYWKDQNLTGHERVAILNFPSGYPGTLRSIAFLFVDATSVADIERVLDSVIFEK